MQTTPIVLDRAKARELFRAYKAHQHYSAPMDREIQRTYQLIAQGRVVIRALESIKQAGLNEQGLPKLAIARATADSAYLTLGSQGGAIFADAERYQNHHRNMYLRLPDGSFTGVKHNWRPHRAIMPVIPIHLRPKRGLANYHVLWEAEWLPIPPRDPLLLRRIGKGDMWLVVAAWDLTEVERAALAARISS